MIVSVVQSELSSYYQAIGKRGNPALSGNSSAPNEDAAYLGSGYVG